MVYNVKKMVRFDLEKEAFRQIEVLSLGELNWQKRLKVPATACLAQLMTESQSQNTGKEHKQMLKFLQLEQF